MSSTVTGREIYLSGDVGSAGDWWFGEEPGFTSSDLIRALAQLGPGDIVVRINSGGGIAWEGSAMHAILARHNGRVVVIVEGVAASAASVIAMAGDEVQMSLGAVMMVHEASGFTVGTAKDHQDQINCLNTLNDALAAVYADKTGQSLEVCRADMAAETWMTPEDAVAKGYADRVVGAPANDDQPAAAAEPAPFAYRGYRHAPAAIVALADAKRWPKQLPKAVTQLPPVTQEPVKMPTEEETQARIDAAVAEERAKHAAPAPAAPLEGEISPPAPAANFSRADAAEIAEICATGGAPTMTAALIREGVSAEAARTRVNAAGQIKDVVALARKNAPHLAADFADTAIAAGRSIDQVKASLFDAMAAATDANPVTGQHMAGAGGANRPAAAASDADARAKSKANMKAELSKRGMSPKEG